MAEDGWAGQAALAWLIRRRAALKTRASPLGGEFGGLAGLGEGKSLKHLENAGARSGEVGCGADQVACETPATLEARIFLRHKVRRKDGKARYRPPLPRPSGGSRLKSTSHAIG